MELLATWCSLYTLRYTPITLTQTISAGTVYLLLGVQATSGPRVAHKELKTALGQQKLFHQYLVEVGKSWQCATTHPSFDFRVLLLRCSIRTSGCMTLPKSSGGFSKLNLTTLSLFSMEMPQQGHINHNPTPAPVVVEGPPPFVIMDTMGDGRGNIQERDPISSSPSSFTLRGALWPSVERMNIGGDREYG